MHSVERLERLLAEAARQGFVIRHEWLGGRGGGACEIAGRKHLFIDLALTTAEQLHQVAAALDHASEVCFQPSRRPASKAA